MRRRTAAAGRGSSYTRFVSGARDESRSWEAAGALARSASPRKQANGFLDLRLKSQIHFFGAGIDEQDGRGLRLHAKRESVLAEMKRRLQSDRCTELAKAMEQIGHITRARLETIVGG